jgi:hypothetical protein
MGNETIAYATACRYCRHHIIMVKSPVTEKWLPYNAEYHRCVEHEASNKLKASIHTQYPLLRGIEDKAE